SEVEGCRPDHLRQGWLSEGGRPALQEAAAGRHLSNVYSRCLSPIHYRAPFNWRPTKFIVGVSFWTLRLKHRLLSTRPLRLMNVTEVRVFTSSEIGSVSSSRAECCVTSWGAI